jgi:hypothetical protein
MSESRPDPQGARLTRTFAKPLRRLPQWGHTNVLVRNNKFRNTCMIGRWKRGALHEIVGGKGPQGAVRKQYSHDAIEANDRSLFHPLIWLFLLLI